MNVARISVAAIALVLTGCPKDEEVAEPFPEGLEHIWGKMFAPYGLYPLFPVRTGVQPGDVVVLCKRQRLGDPPDEPVLQGKASSPLDQPSVADDKHEWRFLFGLKGTPQALADHAKSRMGYLSFPTSASASSAPLGATTGANPFGVGSAAASVGFASFPSILSYVDKRSDFGAGAAAQAAVAGVGSTHRAFSTYILEIPAAEFTGLPHSLLQRALSEAAANPTKEVTQSLESAQAAFKNNTCSLSSLSVVGEVFYARSITVSMADSYANALSARVAFQLPADSTRDAVFKAIGDYAVGASAPSAPASSSAPIDSARFAKLMLDIDAAYKAADDNSKIGFTGVKFGFSKAAGKGISMDYRYAQPVAFGVRLYGIHLSADGKPRLHDKLSLDGSRVYVPGVETPMEGSLTGRRPPQADESSPSAPTR